MITAYRCASMSRELSAKNSAHAPRTAYAWAMRRGFWLLLVLAACERSGGAPLIELSGVTPRRIELGDKLEIEGASLPEGRDASSRPPGHASSARRGGSRRPRSTRPDVSLPAIASRCPSRATSSRRSAAKTPCTPRSRATSSSIFSAATPGAPPVTGSIVGAGDRRGPQGEHARRSDEVGERVLASLGVHRAPEAGRHHDRRRRPTSTRVESGPRGDRALGDRIVAFGGVRVTFPSDIALPPGAVSVEATLTHGASATEETVSVPVDGLAPPARSRVSLGLAMAALALAAILALLRARFPTRSPGSSAGWELLGPHRPSVGAFAALVGAILTLPALTGALRRSRGHGSHRLDALHRERRALGAARAKGARAVVSGWAGAARPRDPCGHRSRDHMPPRWVALGGRRDTSPGRASRGSGRPPDPSRPARRRDDGRAVGDPGRANARLRETTPQRSLPARSQPRSSWAAGAGTAARRPSSA